MPKKPARYVSFLTNGSRHRVAIQLEKQDLPIHLHKSYLSTIDGDWEDSYLVIRLGVTHPGGRVAHFRDRHDMLFMESSIHNPNAWKKFRNKFFHVTKVEYAEETNEYIIRLKYHRDATQITRTKNQEISLVGMKQDELCTVSPTVAEIKPTITLSTFLDAVKTINDYQRARETPYELNVSSSGTLFVTVEM